MTERMPVPITAIVLAAGRSRRMGREKALLPWGRTPTTSLERILAALATAGALAPRVVTRHDLAHHALVRRAAERYGARILENPDPAGEMLESVRLGAADLTPDVGAFFVWPVDHPLVSPATVVLLASGADRSLARIPVFSGRRGHPALVGTDLRGDLMSPSLPEGGLRALWRTRAGAVREVDVPDGGVVANIDTPEAYAEALAALGPGV
jgi:CTP:molybdopterin cytidylyltransferase MocA